MKKIFKKQFAAIRYEGNILKTVLTGFAFVLASIGIAHASGSIQQCMVHAKVLQNPSALAGASDLCMQAYFDLLSSDADRCREEALQKSVPGAELAACQAELILGLRDQIEACRSETRDLEAQEDSLANRVAVGASAGCDGLASEAAKICRDKAAEFSGIARTAANAACEAASL